MSKYTLGTVKIISKKVKEELSKLSPVDLKRKQIRAQRRGDFQLASYISRLSITRKNNRKESGS